MLYKQKKLTRLIVIASNIVSVEADNTCFNEVTYRIKFFKSVYFAAFSAAPSFIIAYSEISENVKSRNLAENLAFSRHSQNNLIGNL